MGGVLDFLFEGQPPRSVTTYGQTNTNVPTWLSDYTQALIARANQEASTGYQPYTGPRLAGFTPDQQAAFGATRNAVGSAPASFGQAETLLGNASTQSALGLATPYLDQAAKRFTGQNVTDYMNPYTQNVIDRAKIEANRNYTENILPTLDNKFIRAGQYGSSAHEREAYRGARDITEGLQSQADAALSQAYTTGANIFGSDQNRIGQVGQTVGTLGAGDIDRKTQIASALQQLATNRQNTGLQGAAALETIGKEQQQQNQANLDLAYGDFERQRDYGRNTIDWLSSIIRGIPYSSSTTTSNTAPLPGAKYGPSGLEQVGSVLSGLAGLAEAFGVGGGD